MESLDDYQPRESGDDAFTLANEPPRPKPKQFASDPSRQLVLVEGLDCLPGQLDLF